MTAGIAVNGLDLGVAGRLLAAPADVWIAHVDGWWDGFAGARDDAPSAREGGVTLNVAAESAAALSAALQALAALMPPRVQHRVTLAAAGDRVWFAERTRWSVTHAAGRQLERRRATVEIGLGGDGARMESRAVRVVHAASTDAAPTPLPLGTLPVWPRLRVSAGATAPAVDPVITVTDLAGQVVALLALDASLAAGDWLDVDTAAATITDQDGVYAGAARVDGDYFALDPADGDPARGLGPAVAVSVTSGSASVALVYPLAWDV